MQMKLCRRVDIFDCVKELYFVTLNQQLNYNKDWINSSYTNVFKLSGAIASLMEMEGVLN